MLPHLIAPSFAKPELLIVEFTEEGHTFAFNEPHNEFAILVMNDTANYLMMDILNKKEKKKGVQASPPGGIDSFNRFMDTMMTTMLEEAGVKNFYVSA